MLPPLIDEQGLYDWSVLLYVKEESAHVLAEKIAMIRSPLDLHPDLPNDPPPISAQIEVSITFSIACVGTPSESQVALSL